ncbi:hypothetical protein AMES_2252 [Amycolatopsis mediterranei S699]|uniref:Uncharacterized protein n=2 Tax=Amycolatopsis mediterranei TaxID=33910 RepID=A0A0H3D3E8_AMYMU|nr:hypothetical protein [Amycolatopsis mediterranei]ADJ44076.1 hypothetical protein AMED_2279 [Amycolatopsis mediterranei U32]AEK40811.1 hypothetical protein RAM_11605 [Amycolatopsis mediterranei S699]AFO75788.1 hypothetical protein AMES_2252 [Amycolatopsis mediterranei S699]AGT82917.1 hypothetical protein B737_2253 [Amycolatopsis mediterranei RB]KDO06492.1 hypothetical protein DV26_32920 [Amycolatopsis mediterranei]
MTRSEHETETLIRDSLDRLAARAPDGRAVHEALARAGRKRQPASRLALVAAAVVVVVVGAVSGMQLLTRPDPAPAASHPVLGYGPEWLPEGFTEQYREGGPGITPQARQWTAGPAKVTLMAYSTADPEWSQTALKIASIKDQVLVRGRVAMDTGSGGDAQVTWLADEQHVLCATVTGFPDARTVAKRIADSVTAEPVGVHGELRFGPLPAGLAERSTAVKGTGPGDARTELTAADPARPSIPVVRAVAGAGAPGMTGATPVIVRGGQGFFGAPAIGRDAMVVVRLPSGRWLTVSGARPEAELIAVANGVQLDPAPDYRWLGRPTS